MHEPIDDNRSYLEILADMHEEQDGLIPVNALSVVMWSDPDGNERVTIFNAQTMSGAGATGMLAQAQYILCSELLEHGG